MARKVDRKTVITTIAMMPAPLDDLLGLLEQTLRPLTFADRLHFSSIRTIAIGTSSR